MMLFKITEPDLKFFIFLGIIVAVFLVAYLVTPIIKRKQFKEARENLKKREETFRANLKKLNGQSEDSNE